MAGPDDIADDLYGAPFDEFIARRDARVRELRKEKRREEADAVKALRKPSLSAWGLNQLTRQDREALDELLAAGAALRQAKGGDTLRDATREERGAVARAGESAAALLRGAGQTVTEKTAGEIRDTLHAAALDDETRELLARGRLTEPRQAIGLGGGFGFPQAPAAPGREKPTAKKARKEKPKPKKDEAAERRERAAEERRAAKERERAARKALREAETVLGERERDLEAAQRAADQARAEVERRRADLDDKMGA